MIVKEDYTMVISKTVKLNLRIIKVLNSCDRKQFLSLINDVSESPGMDIFTKKRYIWNHVRGKDFYKMIAYYIVQSYNSCIEEGDKNVLQKTEELLKVILETTKDESIRKSFIWNIMKQIPLLTMDTIQYASPEKIHSLLSSDKNIIVDNALAPFVEEVRMLRNQIDDVNLTISSNTLMDLFNP